MKKKGIISIIAAASLAASIIAPVSASSFPHAFWSLADNFTNAVNAGDDAGIVEIGKSICELLESSPKSSETIPVIGTRYQDIANAYERMGNYTMAAEYFNKYLPYGRQLGWEDGVRIAETKIACYEPVMDIYMQTPKCPVYFGAKHEPVSGVLFGQVAEQTRSDESMVLIYEEFGTALSGWNKNEMNKAAEAGKAIEVALNFPNEGSTAAAVPYEGAYIESFINDLKPYSEKTPVFLRIGAEINVWVNMASPESYITAYRAIADAARRIAPNIALVWSVNYVSGWDTKVEDYYPGDEYVDWVGLSAYMIRYFQDQTWDTGDRLSEIMFKAGSAADPVFMVKEVVEKFSHKPIMIAEGGSSHYNSAVGDSTDWAVEHLREYYGWLPMVYPQIKLMAYFNNKIGSETNDFSLKNSPALNAAYTEAVQDSTFIKNSANGTGTSYVKLDGQEVTGSINVSCYTRFYDKNNITVDYYIDDVYAASSSVAPYTATIGPLSAGGHLIRAYAHTPDGSVLGSGAAGVESKDKITILYNGRELVGDVPACIIDGRTLVPLRLIFDAMGASVEWDQNTRTVSSALGDRTVSMQVDNPTMIRNSEAYLLDTSPVIKDGRTLVPVRAIAESYGAQVGWDAQTRTVTITY